MLESVPKSWKAEDSKSCRLVGTDLGSPFSAWLTASRWLSAVNHGALPDEEVTSLTLQLSSESTNGQTSLKALHCLARCALLRQAWLLANDTVRRKILRMESLR